MRHAIKFRYTLFPGQAMRYHLLQEVIGARNRLALEGVIGQDSSRYNSAGFGNISALVDGQVVISGTQTGHIQRIMPEHFCKVQQVSIAQNYVVAEGPWVPSSEVMSHIPFYLFHTWYPLLDLPVGCVIHTHDRELYPLRKELGISCIGQKFKAGTPELPLAIIQRWRDDPELRHKKILALDGHEDGFLFWGATPREAMEICMRYRKKAGIG